MCCKMGPSLSFFASTYYFIIEVHATHYSPEHMVERQKSNPFQSCYNALSVKSQLTLQFHSHKSCDVVSSTAK